MRIIEPETEDKGYYLVGLASIAYITYQAWNGSHWADVTMAYLLALCLTSAVWFRFR